MSLINISAHIENMYDTKVSQTVIGEITERISMDKNGNPAP